MEKEKEWTPAYDYEYLDDIRNRTAYLFIRMYRDETHDTFAMIETYLATSSWRAKQDEGNWSALNKSSLQLLNATDFAACAAPEGEDILDEIVLEWMAKVYVTLQWRYNVPSATIVAQLPPKELFATYNPLHETSYDIACQKLFEKYLTPLD